MDKKALTLPILISLVVGNMIGTGIYMLPASLASYGSLSLFAWVFTSLGAIFLALTFANLTKRFPQTGGPYAYCKEAFGHTTGFIIAYIYWVSYLVSIAGIAVAAIGYLGFITPTLNANTSSYQHYFALALEIGAVWLFTIINMIGIHTAGIVQLILTIVKIMPLAAVIIFGFSNVHIANLTLPPITHASTFSLISSAAALTFWAFIGLESATVPAENTQGYADIYKATILGTLLTSAVYILSTFVVMGMVPSSILKTSQFPFAQVATVLFGSSSAWLIVICAVISGLGALNVCILIQGQIVFAAARDHLFPPLFTKLSKHDVPVAGQVLSSTLVSLFLTSTTQPSLLKQFDNIALLAALLTLITYFVTTLAEMKFLFKDKPLRQGLFSKSMLVALLAGAYSLWMITSFDLRMIIIGLMLILLCIPIYFFTVRKD